MRWLPRTARSCRHLATLAVVAERNRDAAWQVATPGVALIIGGPVFSVRSAGNPGYVAMGLAAGAVGVLLLVYVSVRYFRRRS